MFERGRKRALGTLSHTIDACLQRLVAFQHPGPMCTCIAPEAILYDAMDVNAHFLRILWPLGQLKPFSIVNVK